MKDRLAGWGEIAMYLGIHPRTAQKYRLTRGLPVRHFPRSGPGSPVFAFKSELDAWLRDTNIATDVSASAPISDERVSAERVAADFAGPVFERLQRLAGGVKLYRRDYILHFDLSRSTRGIQAKVECRYEVHNATNTEQPYVQEVTIDDGEHGYVEKMVFAVNEKPVYVLRRPTPAKKFTGYSAYRGPQQMIRPGTAGILYTSRSEWVFHGGENDIWYNHVGLPTIGIEVQTHAPPEFEITRSYSTPDLVLKGEHIDIAWNRR
jgi:hypothetical protein